MQVYSNPRTGPDNKTNSQGTISWPDHISDKALERMGLAIIEGSESEQTLQYYRINVWVKAIACISKLAPLISSERLKIHFRTLKRQYEVAAQEELNQLPLAAAPSLGLVQSLLSGVSISELCYLADLLTYIADALDAVSRKHVPLLDVHSACLANYRLAQLPQHHKYSAPKRSGRGYSCLCVHLLLFRQDSQLAATPTGVSTRPKSGTSSVNPR
jgi:hypothetical protein